MKHKKALIFNIWSILLTIGLIIYVISPVDFFPGPVDDAVLVILRFFLFKVTGI